MARQTTDTSAPARSLVPENHYDHVMISKVVRKEVKEFIIYEWSFETLVNDKEFFFKLGMFPSQMADLLRALGAKEVSQNKFDWDDEEVVGKHVSFNVVHVTDKKGIVREQLSDIVSLMPSNNPGGVTSPKNIAWND